MKSLSVTIQMKATGRYFLVMLFIMLYVVVLIYDSVDEILECDFLFDSYGEVLSYAEFNLLSYCKFLKLTYPSQIKVLVFIYWHSSKL